MAKEQEQNQNTVNTPGGLNTDSSLVTQPQGTTRFVMTGVNETKEGDLGFIANEESNQECYDFTVNGLLPIGYVPMGKVYIGEENNAILLANPNGDSAIIIVDKDCNSILSVTDKDQVEKFGFKISQQIDATFRLRRGCERTIYWLDPKPRMFIFDKEEEFKNDDILSPAFGDWDISKFGLFKTYKSIPRFTDIETVDGGGVLAAGSYNFSIRYLDADFNPTEFITSTETIMIYNSPSTTDYRNIEGTTKEEQIYYNFPDSNKAIKITLDVTSLDTTFPFYQYAITEANAGGGLISDTKYTAEISTRQSTFFYTGVNYESSGSQEEVTMFNNIIEKAESIEQIENRLVLGKIKGKQINFCTLQRYASRVAADMITKQVFLSQSDAGNAKDPAAHFNGIGYMPGEIYSFGIVYIFKDRTTSPVFHIPGKGPTEANDKMYSVGTSTTPVYPMSNRDNEGSISNACLSTKYIDNNTCGQDSFWGLDYEQNPLTDRPVRHHRFPLRTDYNIPFVEKLSEQAANNSTKCLMVSVTKASAILPLLCPEGDLSCTSAAETQADFGDIGTGPGTPSYGEAFEIAVEYTEDSVLNTLSCFLDPLDYQGTVGDVVTTADIEYSYATGNIFALSVDVITLTEVFQSSSVVVPLTLGLNPITLTPQYTGTSGSTGLTYTIDIGQAPTGTTTELFKASVFGIKFSNIAKPSLADTDGQEVVGYYIVRNERKQSDKSVLDSAILLPTAQEKNFVSQGLIFPQYATSVIEDKMIKKDVVGFFSPEHKFENTQYSIFSKIIQQGEFKKVDAIRSRVKINDVAPGTGYNSNRHKHGESDEDGFTLHVKTRDNITEFIPRTDFRYSFNDIKEVFYLNALEDRLMQDSANKGYDVFNLACDNKIGILSLKNKYTAFNCLTALPYVYFCRDIVEPYSNFRLEPYYKESRNPELFDILTGLGTAEIFNGDTYISAIRYVNSIYYDTRMKKRAGQTSALSIVLGAILVVAAVLVAVFSLGTLTPVSAALVAAGLGIAAGVGTALILSGLSQDAWNKAYNVLYARGLRVTITDDYLQYDIDPNNNVPVMNPYNPTQVLFNKGDRGNKKNPSDDEVQWLGDCVNLWFESTINMGLRNSFNDNTPSYLRAPGILEQGTTYREADGEYFGIHSVKSGDWHVPGENRDEDVSPTTALDFHMTLKLTYLDATKKSGRSYLGLASGELYLINPDYQRRNKQKSYFHLGLEYDCCTDCVEDFPHRFHWSEQAFQEELTDNFRMFLPNNYKDLEGESGPITDIFRINNNLYVHTAEGLWHCPQTFQERVTQDIVSFIGTGEYFSVPPRKIVDDSNSSSGNRHKWARVKTKYGVLFPSWKEKKWYLFNGESLQPISDNGNANYFKTHMDSLVEQQYFSINTRNYPYSNNPSNPIGVGFISTYDSNKERLIMTHKDSKILNLPITPYEICSEGPNTVIFTNMASTIASRALDGWTYVGIENCEMKFVKTVQETSIVPTNHFVSVPNDMDIHVFYDTSGSYGYERTGFGTASEAEVATWGTYLPQIDQALTSWVNTELVPTGWLGTIQRHYDSTKRWLQFPDRVPLLDRGKVLLLSFCNTSVPDYHSYGVSCPIVDPCTPSLFPIVICPPPCIPVSPLAEPTAEYITDYNDFVNTIQPTYSQFIGVNYPLLTPSLTITASFAFLLHVLRAIKGTPYTFEERSHLQQNLFLSTAQWSSLMSKITLFNPYSTLVGPDGLPGLEQWGWVTQVGRSSKGNVASNECEATNIPGHEVIITPCQFASDLQEIFTSTLTTEEISISLSSPVTLTEYVKGIIFVPEIIKTGWTMSYSLKRQEWVGWHPYIPSFYMHVQEKFYSWIQGSRYLHKHNRPNHYQTFYGVYYPFIVEYVDNPGVLLTKIWDGILFQTEAKTYDPLTQEYYDQRDVTFNKALFYNTEQISGVVQLQPKFNSSINYLLDQTINNPLGVKIIDRNERDWTMNDLRNIRDNYNTPMFIKDPVQLQTNYYIDKIVNPAAINQNLDWTQLENFRDKFLVVRLIFDTFADTRLIFNFSALDKKQSER